MLWIDGEWLPGGGDNWQRCSPADGREMWAGAAASGGQVNAALAAARCQFADWSARPLTEREALVHAFGEVLGSRGEELATVIAWETGKPMWEARTEIAAMRGKIALSVSAQQQRAGDSLTVKAAHQEHLSHAAHGVMAVFGPYNFPGHLPNGHIVPALLAGNTLVFKPSELTPATAELYCRFWEQAGLPAGVLNLLQGGADTGRALAAAPLDGLLFTGSARTGRLLHSQFAGRPEVILALEMGGNNPLLVTADAVPGDIAPVVAQSAFITAGQRCTCARRLLLPAGSAGDAQLAAILAATAGLQVGLPDAEPEVFMGPVISAAAAAALRAAERDLIGQGAESLQALSGLEQGEAFLSPALLDVSAVADLPDEEYFGPLLLVQRYADFDQALALAGATRFGLAAGLLGGTAAQYQQLRSRLRAGIINWNRPLTGASSAMPFGGPGWSGNHRPGAYYAADYCAYPVASLEADAPGGATSPGMNR